jgi:hypothetical protein
MFGWLKRLFKGKIETVDLNAAAEKIEQVKEKVETAKPVAKKAAAKAKAKVAAKVVNFDVMSKKGLLAEAKARGIKANASLKKEELIERLKSA